MNNFTITEQEIIRIKKLYGLISEEYSPNTSYSDGLIPAKSYQIIEDIEHYMGRAIQKDDGTWALSATDHKGNELESRISDIIGKFPGIKQKWFQIDPLFRTQIYSYIFQSGSDPNLESPKNRRWLAGLAQAIDPKINRTKVITNKSGEADTAAKIVEDSITAGTINSFYESYKKKVIEQYQSLQPEMAAPKDDAPKEEKDKYAKQIESYRKQKEMVWSNRPQIIEELYNGKTTIDKIVPQMVSNNYKLPDSEKKSEEKPKQDKESDKEISNTDKSIDNSKIEDNASNNVSDKNNSNIQQNDKEVEKDEIEFGSIKKMSPKKQARIQKRVKRIDNRIVNLKKWIIDKDPTWKGFTPGDEGNFRYLEDGNPVKDKYNQIRDKIRNLTIRRNKLSGDIFNQQNLSDYDQTILFDYEPISQYRYDQMTPEQRKKLGIDIKDVQTQKDTEIKEPVDKTEIKLKHFPELPDRANPAWGETSWEMAPF